MDLRFLADPFFLRFGEGVHRLRCDLTVDTAGQAVAAGETVQGSHSAQIILHVYQSEEKFLFFLFQPGREFFVRLADFIGEVLYRPGFGFELPL